MENTLIVLDVIWVLITQFSWPLEAGGHEDSWASDNWDGSNALKPSGPEQTYSSL